MLQRHISPLDDLEYFSKLAKCVPGSVKVGKLGNDAAAPHFPLSAARQTTFPNLRPVFLGGRGGEKIYEESWALMLQRHISPYQQLGKLQSQTCCLCFWVVKMGNKFIRKARH